MSNRDLMMNWLMSNPFKDNGGKPLTRAQAAAIVGNFQAESGLGFNVTQGHKMDGADNDAVDKWTREGPNGIGLPQWTWNPGRAGNLIALARSLKKQWHEPEVQFQMIRNEMDGGYGARLARAGFFSADKQPGELAIIFHDIYEGSADTPSMKARRAAYAEDAYSGMITGVDAMGTYSNGLIPRSVMKQFRNTGKYGHPVFIDHLEAAVQECERAGIHPFIGSGQDIFRDMAGQVYWKNYWTARGLPRNAAAPGFSNHGLGVCADISGIGARGSATWNKVQAIFKKYGIVFNVASESWHVQDTSISVANNKVTINSSGSKGDYSGNPNFPSVAAFKAVQNGYRAIGYKIDADGYDGPKTQAAVRDFQKKHGLTVDGIHGPATEKALVAAQPKPSKPKPAKPAAKPKPKAPAYPLAKGQYFGPKSGPKQSVSGYFGHKEDLKKWQAQMKKRGWTITVDGLYGDGTARVAKAFQKQLKITQDGLIGATTWAKAWTAPVT